MRCSLIVVTVSSAAESKFCCLQVEDIYDVMLLNRHETPIKVGGKGLGGKERKG
jgi:hypothetical protein